MRRELSVPGPELSPPWQGLFQPDLDIFRFWPEESCLLVIDPLVDFFPGGAFPVWDAFKAARTWNELLRWNFKRRVVVRDRHPKAHISFRTLGVVHSVENTPGAQIHRAVRRGPWKEKVHGWFDMEIPKGSEPDVDAYSGFRDRRGYPVADDRLDKYLKEVGCEVVITGGLEASHGVLDTILHGVRLGHRMVGVREGIGGRCDRSGRYARAEMRRAGAYIVDRDALEVG